MKREQVQQEPAGQSARRDFLRRLAIGTAAAGVAASGATVSAAAPAEAVQSEAGAQGYRETGHIRAYYASCR